MLSHPPRWSEETLAISPGGIFRDAAIRSRPGGLAQAAMLGVLIIAGVAIYGLLLNLFGVVTWADAASALRPSPPRDLRA